MRQTTENPVIILNILEKFYDMSSLPLTNAPVLHRHLKDAIMEEFRLVMRGCQLALKGNSVSRLYAILADLQTLKWYVRKAGEKKFKIFTISQSVNLAKLLDECSAVVFKWSQKLQKKHKK